MITSPLRDAHIRKALISMLRDRYVAETDTLILDELGLASHLARVDIAVINGSFSGYEIKSDVDSLRRLSAQISVYDRVVDDMTLVTGPRFAAAARGSIPSHWGLITAELVDDSVTLKARRKPKRKAVRHFDKRTLAMMLWREELVSILKSYGAYKGLSSSPKAALWDRLCEVVPLNELRNLVRESIKARGNWRADPKSTPYDDSQTRPARK